MKFDDLTPEQQEKARAAKTPEEILALAREEGYELSDEELETVSGGWGHCSQEKYGCGMVGH
ncbi:MAG: Nif11-like leader peptide family natural product precursor [Eggerthellaceae bacterium]|nr:Nif11-like leader peptide family natural product precursor [Eggerthellaceae bacterium]